MRIASIFCLLFCALAYCISEDSYCSTVLNTAWPWLCTQVVDMVAFAKIQATVDFDVNNLKLTKEGLKVKHENEVRLEARTLEKILRSVRTKHLLVLKPAKEVTAKIEKMSKRGWTIHSLQQRTKPSASVISAFEHSTAKFQLS